MSERKVSFVMDGHQCEGATVETGVPQGSLILPILFTIHLSEIFKEVKGGMERCMTTLFVDDCGWLKTVNSVAQRYQRLERAVLRAVEWREQKHVAFNNMKDDMIAFGRSK